MRTSCIDYERVSELLVDNTIIAAAIKYGNVVYYIDKPGRHHDILHELHDEELGKGVQGFIDDKFRFYTRQEAKLLVNLNQQLLRDVPFHHEKELFSEDLW